MKSIDLTNGFGGNDNNLVADEYESDNNLATALTVTVGATATNHSIYPVGDEDWIKFAGVAGKKYLIRTNKPDDINNETDTEIYLKDAAGNPVLFYGSGEELTDHNDDYLTGLSSGIVFDCDETAYYYVRTIGYEDEETGSYTIRVTDITPAIQTITAIGAITGTAQVGQTLTAGAITPAGATVTYQWKRCDTADGSYTNITSATSSTYTLTSDDLDKYIKVSAIGTVYYNGTVTSAAANKVEAATITPITAIGAISGTAQVGQTLTAGAITPAGATVTYQWKMDLSSTPGYEAYSDYSIPGATANTFVPIYSDLEYPIWVVATGTGNYSGTITSAHTANVIAATGIAEEKLSDTWSTGGVGQGGVTSSQTFTITEPYAITYLDTYHLGETVTASTASDTFILIDQDDNVYGPWQVTIIDGSRYVNFKGGRNEQSNNFYWVTKPYGAVAPDAKYPIIPAGTYRLVDSNIATWSTTGGFGVANIKGYSVAAVESDLEYKIVAGNAIITGYTGAGGAVTIPDHLGSFPVTSIDGVDGLGAFENNTSLTSIEIPEGVTSIGSRAFYACTGLEGSLDLPDSVTTIGSSAFEGCSGLTSIALSEFVTSIGERAFDRCVAATGITVSASNANYSSLAGVLFNKNKTTLIQYTKANTVTDYTIPETVTTIGKYAFEDCRNLTM